MEFKGNGDIGKTLSIEEYRNNIRPHLNDINALKTSEIWKMQLAIANIFISSKGNDEECIMHSKSDRY